MTTIRAATPGDARALAALRWEFRAGREPAVDDEHAFIERCTAWMARELQGPTWRAWIAVEGDRIVGQVWFDLIEKVPNPVGERERHGYLSNLYVQPAVRGGVGTQLLETVVAWARNNAVDRIVLWPSARSVTLYLRHAFVRDGDVMELRVNNEKSEV
jgi:GNAT superfamily N-acetyltransferase